jgi:ABC-type multidrug transport system fused ATPase/permease subunit
MIFGAKDWIVQTYTDLMQRITDLRELGRLVTKEMDPPFLQKQIFPLLHSGARALMYIAVAYQPEYFGMPISQLSFLETSIEDVFNSFSYLRESLSVRLIKDMFRIRNLFECMEMESKVMAPDNPVPYKSDERGMKVELKDVSFRYAEESALVLKDVSFTVEAGQIVSIVGYNGSGSAHSLLGLK